MRIESSALSVSWIPSEAIEGMTKLPFEMGVSHYDAPFPDRAEDLEGLRAHDRFRFANELRAWIEVEDGRIMDWGQAGGGRMVDHVGRGAEGGGLPGRAPARSAARPAGVAEVRAVRADGWRPHRCARPAAAWRPCAGRRSP